MTISVEGGAALGSCDILGRLVGGSVGGVVVVESDWRRGGRRERKRVPVLFRDTLQLERVEPSEAMSIAKQFTTHGKKVTTV